MIRLASLMLACAAAPLLAQQVPDRSFRPSIPNAAYPAGKGPVVSFELKGAHPHDVATIIDRAGVAVRAGTHCVMPLLARYGVTATCRASFAMYNTRDEVDALAASLIKAQDFFA